MSTPANTPSDGSLTNAIRIAADLGFGAAAIAFPGSPGAIQLGRIGAAAVIGLYDALMESRPAGVTIEDWRAILASQVHDPGFVDQVVNEARARQG